MWFAPDVPVNRPSVGAMGLACGSQMSSLYVFKPYVYRGTGEDVLTPDPPKPKPKPKPKSRAEAKPRPPKRRKRFQKPKPPPKPKPEGYRLGDEGRAAIQRRIKREQREQAMRERQERMFPPSRPPRPSPGWEPMTVGDLMDLL